MVKILGMLGVPVAIAVHGGTGAIFAVVKARPYWYTGLFPLIFIVSALASGGALLTFIYAFFGRKDKDHAALVTSLGKMIAGFLALDLIFLGSELLVGLYGNVPDHVAVYRAIMFGQFWYVFWGGQILLGAVIPLFLIFNKRTGQSIGWIGTAAVLIVIGIVGVRLNIVIPPFTVPLMPGVDTAYPLGRFSTFDFTGFSRTLFTLAIVVFVVAAGVITLRLSQLPTKRPQRWLARAAGTLVMLGFVVMGLRFLGIGTPITASLFGERIGLPLFFGDAESPVVTASTLGSALNAPQFFGGSIRTTDAAFYSPSAIEWLSSIGIIALAVIGFSLGWLILPLQGDSEAREPGSRHQPIAEVVTWKQGQGSNP